jgi:hypothetical protein
MFVYKEMAQSYRNKLASVYSCGLIVASMTMMTNHLGVAMPPAPGFNGTFPNVSSYCGYIGRNSSNAVCDPNATVCVDDSNCTGLLNYTSCLRECGPQISLGYPKTVTGCLVNGDIMFSVNQSTGIVGYLCYDKSRYAGKESFCGSNGSLYYVENNFTCPDHAPYCFQCGAAGPNAAICLSNFTAGSEGCVAGGSGGSMVNSPYGRSNESSTAANASATTATGCLVGDVMYQVNQSTGYIGFLCYGNSTFLGKESICGSDGSLYDVNKTITCPEKSPYCFQCGQKSYGAAICLSNITSAVDGCVLGGITSLYSTSNNTGTDLLGNLQDAADSLFGGNITTQNLSDAASTVQDILGGSLGGSNISNLSFIGSSAAGNSGREGSASAAASTSAAYLIHLDFLPLSIFLAACMWSTFVMAVV